MPGWLFAAKMTSMPISFIMNIPSNYLSPAASSTQPPEAKSIRSINPVLPITGTVFQNPPASSMSAQRQFSDSELAQFAFSGDGPLAAEIRTALATSRALRERFGRLKLRALMDSTSELDHLIEDSPSGSNTDFPAGPSEKNDPSSTPRRPRDTRLVQIVSLADNGLRTVCLPRKPAARPTKSRKPPPKAEDLDTQLVEPLHITRSHHLPGRPPDQGKLG